MKILEKNDDGAAIICRRDNFLTILLMANIYHAVINMLN